jgi:phosphoglucosamine mutase
VFHELGADVIAIGTEPNGSTSTRRRRDRTRSPARAVLEHKRDIGIALDGDGDRLLMVDREGRCYDGDQLLYVIAMDYRGRRRSRAAWSAR